MRTAVFAGLAAVALARGPAEPFVIVDKSGNRVDDAVGMARTTKEELEVGKLSNTPLQVENFGLGTHPVADGVSVWVDIHEAVFRAVPAWMEYQIHAVTSSSVISPQFPFFFQCHPKTASQCEVFAFAYPCVDCPDFEDGKFMQDLHSRGWQSFRCAPQVEFTNKPGNFHTLLGFRKILSPQEKELFFLDQGSEFFTFAVDTDPQVCEEIGDESDCNSNTKGKCLWEGNECVFNTCRPGGQYGPGICTTHCITLDVPTARP